MPTTAVFWRRSKILQCCWYLKSCASPVRTFCSMKCEEEVIGIDLGTTNSRVAVIDGKVPVIVHAASGRTLPSLVAVTSEGNFLVGHDAKFHRMGCPESPFLFNMKHLIGRKYNDPLLENLRGRIPYGISCASNGEALIAVGNQLFSSTEICAHIIGELKETAQRYTMKTVSKAVIAVPLHFNDAQIQQTEAAGRLAGLDVLRIINEPTAAAFSSGAVLKDGLVAILDFGGGTFDVSLLKITNMAVEVKARDGDAFLGGEDFDDVLVEHLVQEIKKTYSLDIIEDRIAMMRVKEAAEKAKIALSSRQETRIHVNSISVIGMHPVHVDIHLTRSKFEELVLPLTEKIRIPCQNCLRNAGISTSEVTEVILVGGMARVPLFKKVVEEVFRKEPSIGTDPDEIVASGTALLGGLTIQDRKACQLENVTSLSIGIETIGGLFTRVIDKHTRIPSKASLTLTTEADDQSSVLLRILQGERDMASDNKVLGALELENIPAAACGVPQVEVTFDINATGMLSVSARMKGSLLKHSIKIQTLNELSMEDARSIVKEAMLHGKSDACRVTLTELRNLATITITRLEKVIQRRKEELPHVEEIYAWDVENSISFAENALADLKAVLHCEKTSTIRSQLALATIRGTILGSWDPNIDDDWGSESDYL